MKDWLLALWLLIDLAWTALVTCVIGYMVFFKEHSGWWLVLIPALCGSESLYKALRKRFEVQSKEDIND